MIEQDLFQSQDDGSIPISPLQFIIKEISAKTACELNSKWHSRLPYIHWSNVVRNTHYVCYGAFFNGNCFAVGIWSSPVAQNRFKEGRKILELRRMAISDKCPKNTASRMIRIMLLLIQKKFPDITRLISYQDTEVHQGTIYKCSGWIKTVECDGISWTTKKRKRNKEQTIAKKIRWEKAIPE